MAWLYRFDHFLWRRKPRPPVGERLPCGAPIELAGALGYLAAATGQSESSLWGEVTKLVIAALQKHPSPRTTTLSFYRLDSRRALAFMIWPGSEDVLSVASGVLVEVGSLEPALRDLAAQAGHYTAGLEPIWHSLCLAAGRSEAEPLRRELERWAGPGLPDREATGTTDPVRWERLQLDLGGVSLWPCACAWADGELLAGSAIELAVATQVMNRLALADAMSGKAWYYERLLNREGVEPRPARLWNSMDVGEMASGLRIARANIKTLCRSVGDEGQASLAAFLKTMLGQWPTSDPNDLARAARQARDASSPLAARDVEHWRRVLAALQETGSPLALPGELLLRFLRERPWTESQTLLLWTAERAAELLFYVGICTDRAAAMPPSEATRFLWEQLSRRAPGGRGKSGGVTFGMSALAFSAMLQEKSCSGWLRTCLDKHLEGMEYLVPRRNTKIHLGGPVDAVEQMGNAGPEEAPDRVASYRIDPERSAADLRSLLESTSELQFSVDEGDAVVVMLPDSKGEISLHPYVLRPAMSYYALLNTGMDDCLTYLRTDMGGWPNVDCFELRRGDASVQEELRRVLRGQADGVHAAAQPGKGNRRKSP